VRDLERFAEEFARAAVEFRPHLVCHTHNQDLVVTFDTTNPPRPEPVRVFRCQDLECPVRIRVELRPTSAQEEE